MFTHMPPAVQWAALLCACACLHVVLALTPPKDNPSHSIFHPSQSSSFKLVKKGNVNVTFLDRSNLVGYDGEEFVQLGAYRPLTRMGFITDYNSAEFDDVDGILGFGWGGNFNRSASLLKTLSQRSRQSWNITQPEDFTPMPRKFAFTASDLGAELQLGGYDPASLAEDMKLFPMVSSTYSVNVTSITYNGVELLRFKSQRVNWTAVSEQPSSGPSSTDAYPGLFDSGTTCNLLPNTDVHGTFEEAPWAIFDRENSKLQHTKDLVYTIGGSKFSVPTSVLECVEGTQSALILGDPWFRKYVVFHDLVHDKFQQNHMGLAKRNPSYQLKKPDPEGASQLNQHRTENAANGLQKLAVTRATQMLVSKVGLQSESRVTYNIDISVGTPPQKLTVIFDTGSFMLAVFADKPPKGMKEEGLLQSSFIVKVPVMQRRVVLPVAWAMFLSALFAAFVVGTVRHRVGSSSRKYAYGLV